MICIVTRDIELATEIGSVVRGRKAFVTECASVAHCGMLVEQHRDESRTDFRRRIHGWAPAVVVLDVRFGQNDFEALEEVPRLRRKDYNPAVVLVVPEVTRSVKAHAAKLGCYSIISLKSRSFLDLVSSAVCEAADARAAGLLSPLPELEPPPGVSIH